MAFHKIIQVGASGSLGEPILKGLITSDEFIVTVLARTDSKVVYPADVTIIKADFTSHESLVDAFRGQDVAIFTFGNFLTIEETSILLIDAAIEAGVKRIIQNVWGFDIHHAPGSEQSLLVPKYHVRDYLIKKANEGKITWTSVATGLFFDWAISVGVFNLNLAENKAGVYDAGDRKVMLTTLSSISDAVLGILRNPQATENRVIRVHDFFLSNKDVLGIIEDLIGKQLDTFTISTEDVSVKGKSLMPSEQAVGMQLVATFFGEAAAAVWEENDESNLVGLKKKDVKEVVSEALKSLGVAV